MTTETIPIQIYTESTPNPQTLKFVVNKMFLLNDSVDYQDESNATGSPLAIELFGFPFVKGIFIMNNFVTITKQPDSEWEDIIPTMKEYIKNFAASGREAVVEKAARKPETADGADNPEIIEKIKQLLETYVKPAVEMDGGAIQYKSFSNGVLTLLMQGSCSGCPSSTVTLKAGIEGMMKRMVPEVQEVVAESI